MTETPVYRLMDKKLSAEKEGIINGDRFLVAFAQELKDVLGIGVGRPVYLNQAFSNLYVYTDIVYPSFVGDVRVPLLRQVDAGPDAPYGTQITHVFDEADYHRLNRHDFQEIAIYIKKDVGEYLFFEFGRTVVTLNFKKDG